MLIDETGCVVDFVVDDDVEVLFRRVLGDFGVGEFFGHFGVVLGVFAGCARWLCRRVGSRSSLFYSTWWSRAADGLFALWLVRSLVEALDRVLRKIGGLGCFGYVG